MSNPDVSIILVSYNTKELTLNCLKSIYEKTQGVNFDVWVVDNNSDDDTCAAVKSQFSQVHLVENKENLGFGRANNLAISQSKAKYIFLLNSDTELMNNAVKILYDFMESDKTIGACGGNLYDSDKNHIHSYGYFQDFKLKLVRTLKLGRFFSAEKIKNEDKGHNCENLLKQVEVIVGADLFIRKSVLDTIGYFDEDFFMYFEESELQYRIIKAGYKIFINPESKIFHFEGKSNENKSTARTYKMVSEILFYKKCYGNKYLNLYKIICSIPNLPRFFYHPRKTFKSFIEIGKI